MAIQPEGIRARDLLPTFVPVGEGFRIDRKGARVAWDSISEASKQFAAQLQRWGPCRVAVHADRAETVVAALIACVQSGCELALARGAGLETQDFWRSNGVAGLFDSRLSLQMNLGTLVRPSRPAVILGTSGTTGEPKLAIHDIEGLLGRVKAQKEPGVWLLTYHPASFAGLQVLLTALCSGSVLVCADNPTIQNLAEAMVEHEVTHVSGTPTFYRALLLGLRSDLVSRSLRQLTLGGEIADQALLDGLHHEFPGARITHIYASTEAGALFAVNDLRAGFPAEWLANGINGCHLRIRDSVLEVRSPRAMRGYISQSTRLSCDGWLITGDLVRVVGDRVLFLGREDAVIKVGGAKVMPEEVEAILLDMPGVRDARVYGIRNPISGHVLAADVAWVGSEPEREAQAKIFQHLSARLEAFKVPRMYRFSFAPDISEVGKKRRSANGQ